MACQAENVHVCGVVRVTTQLGRPPTSWTGEYLTRATSAAHPTFPLVRKGRRAVARSLAASAATQASMGIGRRDGWLDAVRSGRPVAGAP
jgi:hypothetical protein